MFVGLGSHKPLPIFCEESDGLLVNHRIALEAQLLAEFCGANRRNEASLLIVVGVAYSNAKKTRFCYAKMGGLISGRLASPLGLVAGGIKNCNEAGKGRSFAKSFPAKVMLVFEHCAIDAQSTSQHLLDLPVSFCSWSISISAQSDISIAASTDITGDPHENVPAML